MVAADLDDEASVRAAFEGAYGAYVVTNYKVPHFDAKGEATPSAPAASAVTTWPAAVRDLLSDVRIASSSSTSNTRAMPRA